MKSKKTMYIAIIIVCVIAVIATIIIAMNSTKEPIVEENNIQNEVVDERTQEELKKEFNNLVDNTVNLNGYDTSQIPKFYKDKEIVYTTYSFKETIENKYDVDINLPIINIKNEVGANFNNNTQQIFADKATEVLNHSKVHTIYSVNYTAYVNGDILSVIINATLKEGTYAQRAIVQTYNYNLKTGEEVTIYDAIEHIGIMADGVTEKVNKEITKSIEEANRIQISGYETYVRDINSDIYKIENISTFFIGNNGKLYIVFAYGNDHFTSEMDIIEM